VLEADLPAGAVAYIDRDWLPSSSGELPSLVATPDRALAWRGGRSVRMPKDLDSEAAAALALLAVARTAAAAVEGLVPYSIEIVGRGQIARLVRALVGRLPGPDRRSRLVEQPRAIVDTTGDPSMIVDATQRVADLGTVVLVGESLGRPTEMNLYPDVHARGLSLVGVAAPLEHAGPPLVEKEDPLVESCRETLVGVVAGTPLVAGASWYRLSG
jgi:hypothetical protein